MIIITTIIRGFTQAFFFPYYDMQFTLEKNLKSPGTLKVCVHLGKNKNEEVKEINTLTKVNF